jgi:hypothetical protein
MYANDLFALCVQNNRMEQLTLLYECPLLLLDPTCGNFIWMDSWRFYVKMFITVAYRLCVPLRVHQYKDLMKVFGWLIN